MKLKKSVEEQARDNAMVVHKKDGQETVLKTGVAADHSRKHFDQDYVGMNLGTTLNMGDYEFFRIDVWATVGIEDRSLEQAYSDLFKVLDKTLKDTVEYYDKDNK